MKAGTKVSGNLFGLQLFVADDIHGYKPVTKKCEICRKYHELINGGGWHGSILSHLLFEHNIHQKTSRYRGDAFESMFVTCPDCGRGMENWSWGGFVTNWRCRMCGYEYVLEQRERFDPKELVKSEAESRKHSGHPHRGRNRR